MSRKRIVTCSRCHEKQRVPADRGRWGCGNCGLFLVDNETSDNCGYIQ